MRPPAARSRPAPPRAHAWHGAAIAGALAAALCACGDSSSTSEVGVLPFACESEAAGGPPCDAGTGAGAHADGSLVVDATWLMEHLDDDDVQVLDARAAGYPDGHVRGAVLLPGNSLMTMLGDIGGQVATPEEAEITLGVLGLETGGIAVVYGAPPEYQAARVVWVLRHYGHDARYLDGGLATWEAAGGAVETGDPALPTPTEYTITVDEDLRVTGDWVLEQIGDAPHDGATIQLVDARSASEWAAGHIPTALQINWVDNFEGGLLRPDAELEALYTELDRGKTVVTYCRTGQRASGAWLTLTHLGFTDVRLYDGSWTEWGADARFPVATSP